MPLIDRNRNRHIIYNYLQDNHVVNNGQDFNVVSVVTSAGLFSYRYKYASKGYMVGLLDRFSPLSGALIHFRPSANCGNFDVIVSHGFEADESILSLSLVHKWVYNNPSIITGIKQRIVDFLESASKSDINITAAFIDILGPAANFIGKLLGYDSDKSFNISAFLTSGAYLLQQGKAIVPEQGIMAYDGIEMQDVNYTFRKTYITITDEDQLSSIDKTINDLRYLGLFPRLLGFDDDDFISDGQTKIVHLGPKMIGGDIATLLKKYDDPKYKEYLVNGLASTLIHEATFKTTFVDLGFKSKGVLKAYQEVVEDVISYIEKQIGGYKVPKAPNFSELPQLRGTVGGRLAGASFQMGIEHAAILLIIAVTDICNKNTRTRDYVIQEALDWVDFTLENSLHYDAILYKRICGNIVRPDNIIELDDKYLVDNLLKLISDAYAKVYEIFSTALNGKYPFNIMQETEKTISGDSENENYYFFNRIVIDYNLLNENEIDDKVRQYLAIIRTNPSLGEFIGAKALEHSALSKSDINFINFLRKFGILLALPPGGYHFVHNYKAVIIALLRGKPCLKLSSPSDELEDKIYKINYYGFSFRNILRNAFADVNVVPTIQYMIPINIQVENSDTYVYSSNPERYGDFGVPLWTRLTVTMGPFNDWIFFFGNFVGLDKLAKALRIDPDVPSTGTAAEQPGSGNDTIASPQNISAPPTPGETQANSSTNTKQTLGQSLSSGST
jgi:hypothetical protein